MVQYPSRQIKFTQENISDLLKQRGTRIDPHQIDAKDGHRMYVNPAQAHWLNRSVKAGCPVFIPPMNKHQMKQNLSGGSVFSDLMERLTDKVKDPATHKEVKGKIHEGAKSGVDSLLDKLKDIGANKGLPKITEAIVDKAKPIIQKVVQKGISKIYKKFTGHGMGKNGCGFPRCRGNACKAAVATTPQALYPANQKPI